MSMFIVPVPHFDANMVVEAYWLQSHDGKKMLGVKDNFHRMDDTFSHPGLNIIESIGTEPFTGGKKLFVSLSRMQLLSGLLERVKLEPENLVCTVSAEYISDHEAAPCLQRLHENGYAIALDGFPADPNAHIMSCVEYVMLDYEAPQFWVWKEQMRRQLRKKRAVVRNVPDMRTFHVLKRDMGEAYFTGSFYNRPLTSKKTKLTPIKVNALRLLSEINQEDFEFDTIVKTIERDPYLSVSLLKFLNSTASGLSRQVESIRQAVAVLGQNAVRQWSAIALSATLGEDRPNEITRLALVRAKFAEDVAGAFNLGVFQPALFMAGLFSLLDVMLEKPMEEALKEVAVAKNVRQAILESDGPLAPVMELVYAYERADWDKVSILTIQNHSDMDRVSQAYLNALIWYRKLLHSIDEAPSGESIGT